MFLELTVPDDENIVKRHTQKTEKYTILSQNLLARRTDWSCEVLALEGSTLFCCGFFG
jgi:hypothetical protein